MEGGLGFVGEGGEEGEGWIGGWKGWWEGGEFENRGGGRDLGGGGGGGGWGGYRDSLGSFPFPFPGLNYNFAWVGVEEVLVLPQTYEMSVVRLVGFWFC